MGAKKVVNKEAVAHLKYNKFDAALMSRSRRVTQKVLTGEGITRLPYKKIDGALISKSRDVAQQKVPEKAATHLQYKKIDAAIIPHSKPIPQEWVSKEVVILEAQADKLRRTIARRKTTIGNDGTAVIVDHYEHVLKDLEHQIVQPH